MANNGLDNLRQALSGQTQEQQQEAYGSGLASLGETLPEVKMQRLQESARLKSEELGVESNVAAYDAERDKFGIEAYKIARQAEKRAGVADGTFDNTTAFEQENNWVEDEQKLNNKDFTGMKSLAGKRLQREEHYRKNLSEEANNNRLHRERVEKGYSEGPEREAFYDVNTLGGYLGNIGLRVAKSGTGILEGAFGLAHDATGIDSFDDIRTGLHGWNQEQDAIIDRQHLDRAFSEGAHYIQEALEREGTTDKVTGVLGAMFDTIVNNPQAIPGLLADSAAYMIGGAPMLAGKGTLAAFGAIAGSGSLIAAQVGSIYQNNYEENVDKWMAEKNKLPTEADLMEIRLISATAAIVDMAGDKIAGAVFKKLGNIRKGAPTSPGMLGGAGTVKGRMHQGGPQIRDALLGGAGEFGAEAGASAINRLSYTDAEDFTTKDVAEDLTAGTLGFASGSTLGVPGSAVGALTKPARLKAENAKKNLTKVLASPAEMAELSEYGDNVATAFEERNAYLNGGKGTEKQAEANAALKAASAQITKDADGEPMMDPDGKYMLDEPFSPDALMSAGADLIAELGVKKGRDRGAVTRLKRTDNKVKRLMKKAKSDIKKAKKDKTTEIKSAGKEKRAPNKELLAGLDTIIKDSNWVLKEGATESALLKKGISALDAEYQGTQLTPEAINKHITDQIETFASAEQYSEVMAKWKAKMAKHTAAEAKAEAVRSGKPVDATTDTTDENGEATDALTLTDVVKEALDEALAGTDADVVDDIDGELAVEEEADMQAVDEDITADLLDPNFVADTKEESEIKKAQQEQQVEQEARPDSLLSEVESKEKRTAKLDAFINDTSARAAETQVPKGKAEPGVTGNKPVASGSSIVTGNKKEPDANLNNDADSPFGPSGQPKKVSQMPDPDAETETEAETNVVKELMDNTGEDAAAHQQTMQDADTSSGNIVSDSLRKMYERAKGLVNFITSEETTPIPNAGDITPGAVGGTRRVQYKLEKDLKAYAVATASAIARSSSEELRVLSKHIATWVETSTETLEVRTADKAKHRESKVQMIANLTTLQEMIDDAIPTAVAEMEAKNDPKAREESLDAARVLEKELKKAKKEFYEIVNNVKKRNSEYVPLVEKISKQADFQESVRGFTVEQATKSNQKNLLDQERLKDEEVYVEPLLGVKVKVFKRNQNEKALELIIVDTNHAWLKSEGHQINTDLQKGDRLIIKAKVRSREKKGTQAKMMNVTHKFLQAAEKIPYEITILPIDGTLPPPITVFFNATNALTGEEGGMQMSAKKLNKIITDENKAEDDAAKAADKAKKDLAREKVKAEDNLLTGEKTDQFLKLYIDGAFDTAKMVKQKGYDMINNVLGRKSALFADDATSKDIKDRSTEGLQEVSKSIDKIREALYKKLAGINAELAPDRVEEKHSKSVILDLETSKKKIEAAISKTETALDNLYKVLNKDDRLTEGLVYKNKHAKGSSVINSAKDIFTSISPKLGKIIFGDTDAKGDTTVTTDDFIFENLYFFTKASEENIRQQQHREPTAEDSAAIRSLFKTATKGHDVMAKKLGVLLTEKQLNRDGHSILDATLSDGSSHASRQILSALVMHQADENAEVVDGVQKGTPSMPKAVTFAIMAGSVDWLSTAPVMLERDTVAGMLGYQNTPAVGIDGKFEKLYEKYKMNGPLLKDTTLEIGNFVYSSLGFALDSTKISAEYISELKTALGLVGYATLEAFPDNIKQGDEIVHRTAVTLEEFTEDLIKVQGAANVDAIEKEGATVVFVRPATDYKAGHINMQPGKKPMALIKAQRAAPRAIGGVFGYADRNTLPTFAPTGKVNVYKAFNLSIPTEFVEDLDKLVEQPWELDKDKVNALLAKDGELAIFRLFYDVPKGVVLTDLDGANAKKIVAQMQSGLRESALNEVLGIMQNINQLKESLEFLDKEAKQAGADHLADKHLYFSYAVWLQGRIGMAVKGINPQGSVIDRAFIRPVSKDAEVTQIKLKNKKDRFAYLTAFASLVGVDEKTEKTTTLAIVDHLSDFINSSEGEALRKSIKAIIRGTGRDLEGKSAALTKLLDEHKLQLLPSSDGEVTYGSMPKPGLASYHFAEEFANYQEMIAGDNQGFKSNLLIEIDGITSGFAITLTQMGILPDAYTHLMRVGSYMSKESERNPKNFNQFSDYISEPETSDSYQNIMKNVVGHVGTFIMDQLDIEESPIIKKLSNLATGPSKQFKAKKITNALEGMVDNIYGKDAITRLQDQVVSKAGREIAKYPFMYFNYMASIETIKKEIAELFHLQYSKRLDVIAKMETLEERRAALKALGEVSAHFEMTFVKDKSQGAVTKEAAQKSTRTVVKNGKVVEIPLKTTAKAKAEPKDDGKQKYITMEDLLKNKDFGTLKQILALEVSPASQGMLRQGVGKLLGEGIGAAVEAELGELNTSRTLLNSTFQAQYELYDMALEKLLKETNAKNGKGVAMTKAQVDDILEKIKALIPQYKGFAGTSAGTEGFPLFKTEVVSNVQGQVQIAFKRNSISLEGEAASSISTIPVVKKIVAVGVGGPALMVQNIDAAVMTMIAKSVTDVMHVHDAIKGGPLGIAKKGVDANKAYYVVTKGTDMVGDARRSFADSIQAYHNAMGNTGIPSEAQAMAIAGLAVTGALDKGSKAAHMSAFLDASEGKNPYSESGVYDHTTVIPKLVSDLKDLKTEHRSLAAIVSPIGKTDTELAKKISTNVAAQDAINRKISETGRMYLEGLATMHSYTQAFRIELFRDLKYVNQYAGAVPGTQYVVPPRIMAKKPSVVSIQRFMGHVGSAYIPQPSVESVAQIVKDKLLENTEAVIPVETNTVTALPDIVEPLTAIADARIAGKVQENQSRADRHEPEAEPILRHGKPAAQTAETGWGSPLPGDRPKYNDIVDNETLRRKQVAVGTTTGEELLLEIKNERDYKFLFSGMTPESRKEFTTSLYKILKTNGGSHQEITNVINLIDTISQNLNDLKDKYGKPVKNKGRAMEASHKAIIAAMAEVRKSAVAQQEASEHKIEATVQKESHKSLIARALKYKDLGRAEFIQVMDELDRRDNSLQMTAAHVRLLATMHGYYIINHAAEPTIMTGNNPFSGGQASVATIIAESTDYTETVINDSNVRDTMANLRANAPVNQQATEKQKTYIDRFVNSVLATGLNVLGPVVSYLHNTDRVDEVLGQFHGNANKLNAASKAKMKKQMHTIHVLSPSRMTTLNNSMSLEEVTAHELAHAIWFHILEDPVHGKAAAKMLGDYRARVEAKYGKDVLITRLTPKGGSRADGELAFNYMFRNEGDLVEGGQDTGLHEFAAYMMTNETMIELGVGTPRVAIYEIEGNNLFAQMFNGFIKMAVELFGKISSRLDMEQDIHTSTMDLAMSTLEILNRAEGDTNENAVGKVVGAIGDAFANGDARAGAVINKIKSGVLGTPMTGSKVRAEIKDDEEHQAVFKEGASQLKTVFLDKMLKRSLAKNQNLTDAERESISKEMDAYFDEHSSNLHELKVFLSYGAVLTGDRDSEFQSIYNRMFGSDNANRTLMDKLFRKAKSSVDVEGERYEQAVASALTEALAGRTEEELEAFTTDFVEIDSMLVIKELNNNNIDLTVEEFSELIEQPELLAEHIEEATQFIREHAGKSAPTFIGQAKGLAAHMRDKSMGVINQMPNAYSIINVNPYGNWKSTQQRDDVGLEENKLALESKVDLLASLIAMENTSRDKRVLLSRALRQEASRGEGNGAEVLFANAQSMKNALLANHQTTARDENTGIIDVNPALPKGFTKEQYKHNLEFATVKPGDKAEMLRAGWVESGNEGDIDGDKFVQLHRRIYGTTGVVGVIGAISSNFQNNADSSTAKVANLYGKDVSDTSENLSVYNSQIFSASIKEAYRLQYDTENPEIFKQDTVPNISPIDGHVAGYYMPTSTESRNRLGKDNSVVDVLAKTVGYSYRLESSSTVSMEILTLLDKDYQENNKYEELDFVWVNPYAIDKEGRDNKYKDMFLKLPPEIKEEAELRWGTRGIPMRRDQVARLMGREVVDISEWEPIKVLDQLVGDKIHVQRIVRATDDIVKELITMAKHDIAIKLKDVIVGNIISNAVQLALHGVPPQEIPGLLWEGVRELREYGKLDSEVKQLKMLRAGGSEKKTADLSARIRILEKRITNLEIYPSLQAHMNTSIAQTRDIKPLPGGRIASAIDVVRQKAHKNKITKGIFDTADFVYMAEGSKSYEAFAEVTRYSDVVSRHAMYKGLHKRNAKMAIKNAKRKKQGKPIREVAKTDAEIVEIVFNAFVEYDVPLPETLATIESYGLVMFAKFFLGIQKSLTFLGEQRAVSTSSFLAMNSMMDTNITNVMSSHFLTKDYGNMVYNPLTTVQNLFSPKLLTEWIPGI